MSNLTVRNEVLVSMPTRGRLMTLGQLRTMLEHETVKVLPDDYEILIQEGAYGHSLRLMEFVAEGAGAEYIAAKLPGALTLETPIEKLDLTVRTYNCLKREHVDTIEHLIRQSPNRMLEWRNFNQKSVDEIIEKLASTPFKLQPNDPPLPPHLLLSENV